MRFETVFEQRVSRPIEDWLARLGLARYADAFVAAEIDLDILSELKDADLVELGVLLGDRKRILRASAENAKSATAVAVTERRHPTVMYCDIVDSTDLAVRLAPRDLRAVMSAYHARCADVVAAHGGEAQYLGGGVMVAFAGGPGDAEDADRATRCALALLASIRELPFPGPTRLQTRIGIATSSEAGPNTPSLAARLQRFADSGSALIAEPTRRLLGDAFTFTPLGTRAVTGLAQRVEVWRVEPSAREPTVREATSSEQISSDTRPIAPAPDAIAGARRAANAPLVERHFEDGGEPIAALHRWQSKLERADRHHDPGLRLEALHASWTIAFSIGDLSHTLDATTRGVALYDTARRAPGRGTGSGHDAGVCAAGFRAFSLILTGHVAEGRSWMRRVETTIERLDDPATRCSALIALAIARDLLGEYDVAIALANDSRKIASKNRLVTSLAHAALVSAAARISMGDRIAGKSALENLLDEPNSASPAGWLAYYLVRLAFAEIAAGNERAAGARLAAARTVATERGGCVAIGEIERAAAALLQLRDAPHASVAERLEDAARLAKAQLASLLELRAESDALEFALSRSNDVANATRRIRTLIECIEGGDTTFDVRRARALEQRALRVLNSI